MEYEGDIDNDLLNVFNPGDQENFNAEISRLTYQ